MAAGKSLLTRGQFWYAFISWWIIWAGLQTWNTMTLGFTFRDAILDSIVTNIVLSEGCLLVNTMLKYYLPQKERFWYILILSACLSGVFILITKWLMNMVFEKNPEYLGYLSHSWPVRYIIAFLLTGCMAVLSVLWYTLAEEKENQERRIATERLSREAELFKLRQQLQPHFLFNSLNSISALVGSQPERARTMIQQLSDFLRGTLKKEEYEWVPLKEELQHLGLYLEIEKVRFGHRLSAHINSDELSEQMKLPPMLLQPIVENAIKFGLYDTTGDIIISIHAKALPNMLSISITNPFDAETTGAQHGTGFGLTSVRRRLFLLFSRADLLTVSSHENVFTTSIQIPQKTTTATA